MAQHCGPIRFDQRGGTCRTTLPTLVVDMIAVSPPGRRFLTGPVVAPNKRSTGSREVILGIDEVFAPLM